MTDDEPREVKKARLKRLQDRIADFNRQYMANMVGTTQRVLVERESKRGGGQMAGRTDSNRWVNFEGHPRMAGHFVEIEITEALDNSLRGRIKTTEPVADDAPDLAAIG